MPFQISSVLVAAEAIWKRAVSLASDTNFFITNSAMGERQMLPWQMKSTFIIVLVLLDLPRNVLLCGMFRGYGKCSEITDCGKSEQNKACCYNLLVVKLVVKGKSLLLRIFRVFHDIFYISVHCHMDTFH